MINPNSLIKLDSLRDDKGTTFDLESLPPYENEDYDLQNPKDFGKFIKDVKAEVRGSFEYKEMIKYLKDYGGMDRSGLNQNVVSNNDDHRIKIEIHHTPLVLEDIVRIVYEKRLFYHEDLSVQMVAKEVMECHYRNIVGLYPVSSTEHELLHNGYLYIPPNNVYGNWERFITEYHPFIDPEELDTIEEIKDHVKVFSIEDQNKLLSQSNIYINPSNVYELPQLENLQLKMSNRIESIKDNMYTLPILNEEIKDKPKLVDAIHFVNDKGEYVDEPNS